MKAGEKMYWNHFTPQGHRAFADAFVGYLVGSTGTPPAQPPAR
jgi:hypothetical protein